MRYFNQKAAILLFGDKNVLSAQSGDNQTDNVNSALSNPLVVRVLDADGNAVVGITVYFNVLTGGGSVSVNSAVTNGSGDAQTSWTLGSRVGTQTVAAFIPGLPSVVFSATANAVSEDVISHSKWALMHLGYGATALGGDSVIDSLDKSTMLGILEADN